MRFAYDDSLDHTRTRLFSFRGKGPKRMLTMILNLYVAEELERSVQYIFSFTSRNPNCSQTCQVAEQAQLNNCGKEKGISGGS
jgi:hypothetical protein